MILIRLFSRLPCGVLYGLSDFLFFVSYYVVGYRRKLVRKNLKNSFPEKSGAELKIIEREFYKNLCDYAVETLKLLTISKEELDKRIVFKNKEAVLQFLEKNQSVFFFASHQFNWEWLLAAGCFAYPCATDFIYQPLKNKFFNRLSIQSRTRFGAYPIKRKEVARETIKRQSVLRGVAIVADQYPGYKTDKKYSVTFLHQETAFFYGANQMVTLTQYPAIFHAMKKIRRGYYEATAILVGEPPYARDSDIILKNYIEAVEKNIRENPSGWLWSHNRWKKRLLM